MYDELVKRLHRYSENCVAYKLDADFADAVQQAADAIEELSGFVQEAERDRDEYKERLDKANDLMQKRWIPVTERLPKEDERVLVVAHRINDNTPVVCIDSVEADETELKFSLYSRVGYWMPLPETPKDGEA